MSRQTHCSSCPVAAKKTDTMAGKKMLMHPLFPNEETTSPPSDTRTKRQEQALREAIAPYLCLAELRRLAAGGENVQAAIKNHERVPEEVQALLSLLQVFVKPVPDERITQPSDVAALLMLQMGLLDHEELWVVCLDTKNHVQRIQQLYKGSLNSSVVRVGEVFRLPLLLNSAAIIVAHNHPSGSSEASPEDVDATRSIIQAGELLQVEVLDHLIIGQGSWLSMREQRLGW
jgi:DNA repair protein RadC